MLSKGWGGLIHVKEKLCPVPTHWVIKLPEGDWPDNSKVAMFHSSELWIEVLPGDNPDFAKAATGNSVALVCDRSSGIGKDRMLHWEIAELDPNSEDILDELTHLELRMQTKGNLTH